MSTDIKEKLKALQLTIDKLDKAYGKGTVMKKLIILMHYQRVHFHWI
jgi:hypothetical protein